MHFCLSADEIMVPEPGALEKLICFELTSYTSDISYKYLRPLSMASFSRPAVDSIP